MIEDKYERKPERNPSFLLSVGIKLVYINDQWKSLGPPQKNY